jgi:hypothetical protein
MPPLTLLAFLVILTTWHPDQRRPNLLVVVECRAPWPIRPRAVAPVRIRSGLRVWTPRNSTLLTDPWLGSPGRTGRWPPRLSSASPMRASGERKPKAIRVSSRILVLTDSISALDRPCI